MASLGKKIKDLREQRGLTPDELADHLHFTKSIIWSYEIDKREPNLIHLNKLADYFGVSIDYLLNRDYEKTEIHLKIPTTDLTNNYSFIIDNEEVSGEELEEAISFIRAKRIMKKEKAEYIEE
ncbi:helix-turn-helix domain-containing protein [Bacillus sp. Marseille-P3661]|uniref:helix-turn-helix domain-containing protein n=1 Tax=Bacillus sp. Marseille-P3661 TaxID=1936234 RepID=UPI000C852273|nr:helix-turn-helix transcriptional regulator [Bacillus sp. Marseille-P3661]